jgi:GTPase SAR1 family protein
MASMYYQEAAVAVLVYDITSRKTFDALKNWIEELVEKAPENILIAILANKSDLLRLEEVNIEEAKKYADDNNALFIQTSAKEGTGIKELFDLVAIQLGLINSKRRGSMKIRRKCITKKGCC